MDVFCLCKINLVFIIVFINAEMRGRLWSLSPVQSWRHNTHRPRPSSSFSSPMISLDLRHQTWRWWGSDSGSGSEERISCDVDWKEGREGGGSVYSFPACFTAYAIDFAAAWHSKSYNVLRLFLTHHSSAVKMIPLINPSTLPVKMSKKKIVMHEK